MAQQRVAAEEKTDEQKADVGDPGLEQEEHYPPVYLRLEKNPCAQQPQ